MPGPRIIVLDDERAIRRIIAMALSNAGYEVKAFSSGALALEEVEAFRPTLFVTDYKMPGSLDGLEVISALREIETTLDIPIILLTGSVAVMGKLQKELANERKVTVLSKPFSPRSLARLVDDLLEGDNN